MTEDQLDARMRAIPTGERVEPRTFVNAAMRGDPFKPKQMVCVRPGGDAHLKVKSLGVLAGRAS